MKSKNTLFGTFSTFLLACSVSLHAQFTSVTNCTSSGIGHETWFLNSDTGFVAGEQAGKGVIQKTTDAGQTWTNVYTSTGNLEWVWDICFYNATTGIAVGENGTVLKTVDGGNSWTRQNIPGVTRFSSVYFVNAFIGYAAGETSASQGVIYKSTDGGNNWSSVGPSSIGYLNDVFFVNAQTGYAVGEKEILKTTDGGTNWVNTLTGNTQEYNTIYCSTANVCYIGGSDHIIRKTTDGGISWNPVAIPSPGGAKKYYTTQITFTDAQTGYASGAIFDTTLGQVVNGTILKTTNAGLTWSNINTAGNNTALQSKNLESVFFVNSQNGFAVGAAGVALKTTNAGTPPCNLTLSVSVTNAACGQPTGTATVVATGGSAPYSYQWTNGDKGAVADSMASGLYMVIVTDALGCSTNAPAAVSDANSPSITVTSTANVSCNGGSDGSINITVSGAPTPFTYQWVNGATTQDVSGLVAGPYQVEVTSSNGCKSVANITISQPQPNTVSVSVIDASCGSANGSATANPSGGSAPYTYLWSTGSTIANATGLTAGGYSVVVTDLKGCTVTGQATIVNVGGAVVVLDSVKHASCASGLGSIYVSVSSGAPPYTYAWSNGATTQDLVGVAPGSYHLVVHGTNPCDGAFSGVINFLAPQPPPICIVTVDSVTEKNVCVFSKDTIANPGIAYYKFYRESVVAGQYQFLGTKAANLPSAWTDQSANPLQHAWRYKVSAVDTCGNESALSSYHKTIHLAANIGTGGHINLAWDDYEGFSYPTFVIYRFTWATGWDSLDAVSGNVHAYTDLSTPSPITDVYYYVSVQNTQGCAVSIKGPPQPMTSNLNLSKSNINRVNPTPTGMLAEQDAASNVLVYPNPSTGNIIIRNDISEITNAEVYNMFGALVFKTNMNGNEQSLKLDLSAGIYFLKVKCESGTVTRKIVVQK